MYVLFRQECIDIIFKLEILSNNATLPQKNNLIPSDSHLRKFHNN
jgi:hypothetical protein